MKTLRRVMRALLGKDSLQPKVSQIVVRHF
jgi:hypothetical protein